VNRSRLADLSEIISSVAIVLTLVYLTVEMNQNTNAMNAQTRQAVMEAAQNELFVLMDNPGLTISIAKTGELSAEEQIRLDNYFTASLRSREFSWLQYQDGSIDELQWATEQAVLRSIFDSRQSRDWWNALGQYVVGNEFGAFVDDLLQQNAPTETIWNASANWSTRQGSATTAAPQ